VIFFLNKVPLDIFVSESTPFLSPVDPPPVWPRQATATRWSCTIALAALFFFVYVRLDFLGPFGASLYFAAPDLLFLPPSP